VQGEDVGTGAGEACAVVEGTVFTLPVVAGAETVLPVVAGVETVRPVVAGATLPVVAAAVLPVVAGVVGAGGVGPTEEAETYTGGPGIG